MTTAEQAAQALAEGRLAVLPTETVYGLGARADMPQAVARIYAAKGRPADHPLIAHLHEAASLAAWATAVPDYAQRLAEAFWPGPLTLVLPRSARAGDWITGGQDAVALRVSAHPLMLEVGRELARIAGDEHIAIAAPSANRFGRVSSTTAEHAREEIGAHLAKGDVILDGGPCMVGLESTIIDCTGQEPRLLRPGGIGNEDIERISGAPLGRGSSIRASGTLASHYAPRARVLAIRADELQDSRVFANKGLIALADIATPAGMVRLTAPATVEEYAQHLYMALREADALQLAEVLAVLPPEAGLGAAIRDRLERASR